MNVSLWLMNQSCDAHHSAAAAPLPPRGGHALKALPNRHQRWLSRQPTGAEGLPQSKHGHELNALPYTFAPPAGLEPATYGLEVDPRPSMPSRWVPSSLVTSGGPSS